MKKMLVTLCSFLTIEMWAQTPAAKSPDFFESTGKIYVVVGVLAMILLGIIAFLVSLERKANRLEKMSDWTEQEND